MVDKKIIFIPADFPSNNSKKQHLRVAAYCRVSTKREEQESSLKIQIEHFRNLIADNPEWSNVGIYAEQASGLKFKSRTEFQKMMRKCRRGKIDLILMKSISRFGRNTLDVLIALRELRRLGVDVYFESQELWLHQLGDDAEMVFTMLSAFAQNESESMSRNIQWGIRRGFQAGTSGYAQFACFGYRQDENGNLVIHEEEAEIVRRIFQMRAAGHSLGRISDWLFENEISTPRGKARWSSEAIRKLLKNEKYVGDVLLQKTYVEDVLTGKQIKNDGEKSMVRISNHHPAIILKDLFEKVNHTGNNP